eukprot:m.100283 g.100283  ORF g.100283 m.100283 type:complete len:169 (-) comp13165_c0_seq1:226-732(-)
MMRGKSDKEGSGSKSSSHGAKRGSGSRNSKRDSKEGSQRREKGKWKGKGKAGGASTRPLFGGDTSQTESKRAKDTSTATSGAAPVLSSNLMGLKFMQKYAAEQQSSQSSAESTAASSEHVFQVPSGPRIVSVSSYSAIDASTQSARKSYGGFNPSTEQLMVKQAVKKQ